MFVKFVSVITLSLVMFCGLSDHFDRSIQTLKPYKVLQELNLGENRYNGKKLEGTWSIIYTNNKQYILSPCFSTVIAIFNLREKEIKVNIPLDNQITDQIFRQDQFIKGKFQGNPIPPQFIRSELYVLYISQRYLVLYQVINNNQAYWTILRSKDEPPIPFKDNEIYVAFNKLNEAGIEANLKDLNIGRYCGAD